MEAQRYHGTSGRQLKFIWYGRGLALWAVIVLVTGLLVLLGQVRQVEQAFITDTHAALRRLEQALQANQQALVAMVTFLEADPERNFADFNRYVTHLLQAYPQIRSAAILLLPDGHDGPLELAPLAGEQLAQPVLASLHQSIASIDAADAAMTVTLIDRAPGQEAFLLTHPLQLQETDRLVLLLEIAAAQLLPAAETLPSGMGLAVRLLTPTADASEVWWRANDYHQDAGLVPLPTLRFNSRIGSPGQVLEVSSYRRLSWAYIQPQALLSFAAAAVLGLLLSIGYGRSRIQREQARREAERELYRLANYDSLTGLPNRNLFKARLQRALTQARLRSLSVALCFVDLDGFKAVNDSAGHEAGDRLLQLVAQRLRAAVRSHDTVARLSGDEFVVVMEGISDREDAERVIAKLRQCFRQAFAVGAFRFELTASIGHSVFPEDGEHPAQLLRCADARMYASKYADWGTNTALDWLTAEAVSSE